MTNLDLPLIWPALTASGEQTAPSIGIEISRVLADARSLFGTVHDLDNAGIVALECLLDRESNARARIVLPLFPACPMSAAGLARLLALQNASADRVQFRILIASSRRSSATTVLCAVREPEEMILACGPTGPFTAGGGCPGQGNVIASCEPLLRDRLCRWFDHVWERATPLNPTTAALPHFSLLPASPTADAVWEQYEAVCRYAAGAQTGEEVGASSNGNGTGPAGAEHDGNAARYPSVTAQIGIASFDIVADEIRRILMRGVQVIIDGTTRIPPLATPIPADWFGIEPSQQFGLIRRNTRYQIDAFDGRTQSAIENRRKGLSNLLRHLCFSLGNSVYWIPHTAVPLMEREVERLNGKGAELLTTETKGDISKYVQAQRDRVAKDARKAFEEVSAGGTLPSGVVEKLLEALEGRLNAARAGRFVPSLSYSDLRFRFSDASSTASAWGQPLTLLHSIAQFPRKVLTDKWYLRGTEVGEAELLPAMNVAGDHLIALYARHERIQQQAQTELDYLDSIMESEADARARCKAILGLLRGASHDAIQHGLDAAVAESAERAALETSPRP